MHLSHGYHTYYAHSLLHTYMGLCCISLYLRTHDTQQWIKGSTETSMVSIVCMCGELHIYNEHQNGTQVSPCQPTYLAKMVICQLLLVEVHMFCSITEHTIIVRNPSTF